MYHPNTSSSQCSTLSNDHANATSPSTWFVNLHAFKPPEDTSVRSKLKLLFLLDSRASIYVLDLPTFTILLDHFLKCATPTPTNIGCKTVANKAEDPILFNVILTLHTSIHRNTRSLVIPIVVAKIIYKVHGTPFIENYVKTVNIEHMTLTLQTHNESDVNVFPLL